MIEFGQFDQFDWLIPAYLISQATQINQMITRNQRVEVTINNKFTTTLAIATLMATAWSAPKVTYNLNGISYRNSTTVTGMTTMSFMGGAPVFIRATGGLDSVPTANDVFLEYTAIKSKVRGPKISDDDVYTSNAVAGNLGYTVPALTNAFSTTTKTFTYYDFDGVTLPASLTQDLELSVSNSQGLLTCKAVGSYCRVRYDEIYTPMFIDTVPNQVTYGMTINFVLNANKCHSILSSEFEPFYYLKLGQTNTNWEGKIDSSTRLLEWQIRPVTTVVGSNQPAKSVDPDINFTRTGNVRFLETSKHCNFAGTDCWRVRVHPKIDGVSNSQGYWLGGQTLIIYGWGLKGLTSTTVTVDGIACKVDSARTTNTQLYCETGYKGSASVNKPQPGQPGITYSFVNPTDPNVQPDWANSYTAGYPTKKSLTTTLETLWTPQDDRTMNNFDGWFKAPKTGQYRFYIQADDQYKLFLDQANPYDPVNPVTTSLVEIGQQLVFKAWRAYYHQNIDPSETTLGKFVTDPINLVEGKYYKIRGQHKVITGAETWSTVSVEFLQPGSENHPMAAKAVQSWRIEQTNIPEQWTMTILTPSTGKFKLTLQSPNEKTAWQSQDIVSNSSADTMKWALYGFFSASTRTASDISVTLVMYDGSNVVTTNAALAKKYVYTVKLMKRITGFSFTKATVLKESSNQSVITIVAPNAVGGIASSAPMSGKYTIQCTDSQGVTQVSPIIDYTQFDEGIRSQILSMPFLRGKVRVYEVWGGGESSGWGFKYRENGKSLIAIFHGFNSNPPLCKLVSDSKSPITGNKPVFKSEIIRPYGQSLMFEPVGLEFLYSDAQSPQVLVNVDGLPALCVNLNCDYNYVEPNTIITGQTYNPSTKVLIVTGTNLPTNWVPRGSGRRRLQTTSTTGLTLDFGGATCVDSTPLENFTSTKITCTLTNQPRAGDHLVSVSGSLGQVAVEQSVPYINIGLTLTTVSPPFANALGGTVLTLTGSGFPIDTSLAVVTLTTPSGSSTCKVLTTNDQVLTCEVQQLTATGGQPYSLSLEVINPRVQQGTPQTQNTAASALHPLTVQQGLPSVTGIIGGQTDYSPVIKLELTFQLSVEYEDILKREDLLVQIKNAAKNYSRDLYVMRVDNVNKRFTVKFNGAPPALYDFQVTANSVSKYGRLDTSAIVFRTSSTVTAVIPNSGSVFGGTVLTITGTNFSEVILDQVVKVGDIYCDILSATTSQLVCRIRPTGYTAADVSTGIDVVVTLAASFESACVGETTCKFEFKAPTATVASVTPNFDAASNSQLVTLIGTGFTAGNTSSVQLWIDGVKQTTSSVDSDTQAVFTVIDAKDVSSSSVIVYFADGLPADYNLVSSLTFTPTFVSVTPNTGGSQGGTLLTVKGTGFGVQTGLTSILGLKNVTKNVANLCTKVEVTGYGTFTCLTSAVAVASTDVLNLTKDAQLFSCSNADSTKCQFSQLAASSPTVTAVVLSGNTITFTGTQFPSPTDYTAKAVFKSAQVAVTTWTSTSLSATFTNGVPAASASENAVPKIWFTRNSDSVILINYSSAVTLSNVLTVTAADSTTGIQSSFAGGLSYTITKDNIFATLKEAANSLTICGNPCVLDDSKSNQNKAVCTVPALATTFSASTYKIKEASVLSGTWTAKVATEVSKLTDNIWPTEYTDSGANCWIELAFPDTQVGVLNSVKILINNLSTTKAPFAGVTKLQGFDGTSYIDVLTLDSSIHEGWNTFEWDTNKPAYQKYKWTGATAGSCRFGEIKYTGIVSVSNNNSSIQCTPKLVIGTSTVDLSPVTYSDTQTATITKISPRYGAVQGNEVITITGTNFVAGSTTVTIDKIPCAISTINATQITCTTGARPGDEKNPSFVVNVNGKGIAANQGNTFRYVNYWSNPLTWNNDAPPQLYEAIQIPEGRSLLIDVDSVPQLSFVLVEGALIFAPHSDPTHQRTFDVGFIFINGGYMEVGSEEFPYTSKLTITMHGDVGSPQIPTFGNKNIAVRKGELHMVGQPRSVIWTMLDSTAAAGASQITLLAQPNSFDWQVNEEIVIASTDYDHTHSETAIITAVATEPTDLGLPAGSSKRKILTLDKPLKYQHFAKNVQFGSNGDFMEMRAEVGLLSRNLKFQGDLQTSEQNKYGATIMLHYPEDESCIGRILYTELFNVGQAYQLGRYPINFHVIGTVSKSLVKGNSIHQSFNRAITIHAVSYLTIENNVIYNVMGHAVFIEDAIETKNVIKQNLVVSTRRSFSLLNTDQTPASFWITHPDNIFIGNHAAGSDSYGFWFDMQKNPINGSYTSTICPCNEKLGEFRDNEAHSHTRFGLRIFQRLIPRQRGCDPWIFNNSDPSVPGSPFPANPAIPARFYNLVSWKNGVSGAIAEEMGAVEWHNFKVADNMQAGLEWSFANNQVLTKDIMLIKDALVIGKSENYESVLTDGPGARGIIGPRWDFMTIRGAKFFNFDFKASGALGDCSGCGNLSGTDSGARTIYTSGLFFDSTVPKRIWYETPYRGIFNDLDGTLTDIPNGEGVGSWATAYWKHNEQAECTKDLVKFDGLICKNTAQVRRIAFNNFLPSSDFYGKNMKVLKYDDSFVSTLSPTDLKTYTSTAANFSVVPWRIKLNPLYSWAVPFVTGHKYRIFWDIGQLNWTTMKIEVSLCWQPSDKNLIFNNPYTQDVEAIDFFGKYGASFAVDGSGPLYYPQNTLTTIAEANWISGMNSLDTTKREVSFVINGAAQSSQLLEAQTVKCRQNEATWCLAAITVTTECTGTPEIWSDPATWGGTLPVDGQDVEIPAGRNIVFNLAMSPKLNMLKVIGCLSFLSDNSKDQTLQAHQIFVFGGQLNIGTSSTPFTRKATIILYGTYDDQFITMNGAVEAGNKMIANVGQVKMYGKVRSRMSRLLAECAKGSNTCSVEPNLDWVAGDQLGFAPTATNSTHYEVATIQSYDSVSGSLVLASGLKYYHFGAAASTASKYQGLDMRGEVVLLTRNIVIKGDQTLNNWHGQFLTTDTLVLDGNGGQAQYKGQTILSQVEFYKMGQLNNLNAALRFENSNQADASTTKSSVDGVVIHESVGWGISVVLSSNISLRNIDVFAVSQIGVSLDQTTNVSADSVNVFGVQRRNLNREACFAVCSYTEKTTCQNTSVINSIAAGCPYAGFIAPGYSCNDPVGSSVSNIFKNNVAHSVHGSGFCIFPDTSLSDYLTCYQGSHLFAYKNEQAGIGVMQKTDEARFSNIVSVDNTLGISINLAGQTENEKVSKLSDSFVFGETSSLAKDCPDGISGTTGAWCDCSDKMGYMSAQIVRDWKSAHNTDSNQRPVYKTTSYATWNQRAIIQNVQFADFTSTTTQCGASSSLFGVNPFASDLTPMHFVTSSKFTNVNQNALFSIYDPPQEWAVVEDCGEWPCTGPSNIVYTFKDSVFEVNNGSTALPSFWTASTTKYNFQVVSDMETAVATYPNCAKNEIWNAWFCADPAQIKPAQIGTLLFESLDYDTESRSVQPVVITNDEGFKNVINSFRDHSENTLNFSQKRLSRFPAQILTGKSYTLTYTGTPFKNARYTLKADSLAKGILVKIPYPNAGSYSVKVNGKIIEPQKFDQVTQQPQAIDTATATCGANLYVGVVNYLQFFITPGCTINVIPRDAIMTSVRLQWTAEQFFKGDGATTFTQRLAAVLGIDITRVKIVSVYEGSLNVEVQILDDPLTQTVNEETQAVTSTQQSVVQLSYLGEKLINTLTNASPDVLGAPVLEVQAKVSQITEQATEVTQMIVPTYYQPTTISPGELIIGGAQLNLALSYSVVLAAALMCLV